MAFKHSNLMTAEKNWCETYIPQSEFTLPFIHENTTIWKNKIYLYLAKYQETTAVISTLLFPSEYLMSHQVFTNFIFQYLTNE